jgi:predicted transcriptional regulator
MGIYKNQMGQENLKEIIRDEGITVRELHEACGREISESSLRRYLNGSVPKDAYKGKIKKAINSLTNKKYEISDIWTK